MKLKKGLYWIDRTRIFYHYDGKKLYRFYDLTPKMNLKAGYTKSEYTKKEFLQSNPVYLGKF